MKVAKLREELKQKSLPELKVDLTELLKKQLKLRLTNDGEQTKTHEFKKVRRSIARILTIMGQKKKEGNA